MGDDRASWAVFRDGKVVVSGLEKREVEYYKKLAAAMEYDLSASERERVNAT
jgi:hypothetical protein